MECGPGLICPQITEKEITRKENTLTIPEEVTENMHGIQLWKIGKHKIHTNYCYVTITCFQYKG